jgi:phage protein D
MLDQAIFQISVGGTDVTETFDPILQQLQVEDHSGESTDRAMVTLADVDGAILLPSVGDSVNILLGWKIAGGLTQVFDGIVDEVASRGGRGAGRLLVVKAHGFDTGGKAKEPQQFHKDNASLQDFLSQAAGNAGLSFQAEGSVGGIQRPYWVAGTESFIHLGQRIAHEVGAVFKIEGTQAYMWPLNTPLQAAGSGGGNVTAIWGEGNDTGNLIEWDISPIVGRPQYAQTSARWFDHTTATWKEVTQSIGGIGSDYASDYAATHTHRQTRADAGEATTTAAANAAISTREAGTGIVTIVGQPAAFCEGSCTVSGVRAGVDGTYRIAGVRHELNRSSGFITQLELKQPGGGAGTDPRPVVPNLTGPPPIDSVPPAIDPATPPT